MSRYTVFAECINCKMVYQLTAERGTTIPDLTRCPNCDTQSLKKTNARFGGYDAELYWDGSKFISEEGGET